MGKQMTAGTAETKNENENSAEQHEAIEKLIAEREVVLLTAVVGKDDPQIAPGHPLWIRSLEEVRALYRNYERSSRAAADLLEKEEKRLATISDLRTQLKVAGQPMAQVHLGGALEAMPRAIILPDGMRIVLSRLAAYHPSGDGEIEFKTSDGKTLSMWSAPQHSATGSHDAKTRRTIRDKVIQQLDKLFDAMD